MDREKTGKKARRTLSLLLAGVLLLGGCGAEKTAPTETVPPTEYTVPADGDPGNETCLGSYSLPFDRDAEVARVGKESLHNGELNIFYHLAVSQFEPEEGKSGPDFSLPLEGQTVPGENITWQQFFLAQALEKWHSLQALEQKSREPSQREEVNFTPRKELHDTYMKDMPANRVLYQLDNTFSPNKVHQEYLDNIPKMLETLAKDQGCEDLQALMLREFGAEADAEAFEAAVWLINYAYMYFTELTYYQEPTEEEILEILKPAGENVVDMRHILLQPEDAVLDDQGKLITEEDQWEKLESWAKDIVNKRDRGRAEQAMFANQAHDLSRDQASAFNGGLYANVRKGQLLEPLDQWCFDPERESGDVGIVRSDFGVHVIYLSAIRDAGWDDAVSRLKAERMEKLVEEARKDYPMDVDYEKITLTPVTGRGKLRVSDHLLYPDVAHERICEVPVYIQQDYLAAPYGGYRVSSHGCGITSLAMLATYMSDTILTPGMLAARYGSYSYAHGTDSMIFYKTPPDMGFYVHGRSYEWDDAEQALWEGRKVINLQIKGYFTRGGHYLVLSEINPDETIVIRDSNIYNYKRLPEHAKDAFPASRFPPCSQGYWIYDHKILRIPFCSRCGEHPEEKSAMLREEYLCPKCITAMDRRDSFLKLTGLN